MFICEHQCPGMSASATSNTPGSITRFRQVGYGILLKVKIFDGRLPPPRACPRAPTQ